MIWLKKELDKAAESAMQTSVHIAYIMVGNHFLSTQVQTQNVVLMPSPKLGELWRLLDITPYRIYQHFIWCDHPKLAKLLSTQLEEQRKANQKAEARISIRQ
jgi:hypothetical protein